MESVIAFVLANQVVLLAFLFALSEVLALIPAVKSNSIAQIVFGFIEKAYKKVSGK